MLRTVRAAACVWIVIGRNAILRATLDRIGRRRDHESKGTPAVTISEQIRREILSWPGVTVEPHRFGGIEFRLGKRELGHLHGDYLADLPFPVRVREELVREGRAMHHHILPQSGWVSFPIRGEADLPGALALFRLAYDRATSKRAAREPTIEGVESTPAPAV